MPNIPQTPTPPQKGSPFTRGLLALEKEEKRRQIKKFLFGFFTLVFAWTSGWTLGQAVERATPLDWLWFLLAFLLWVSFFALVSIILNWKVSLFLAISSVGLLLFSYWPAVPLVYLILFVIIGGLGVYFSGSLMAHRHAALLHFASRDVLRSGLPALLFVLAGLFSFVYYLVLVGKYEPQQFFIEERQIRGALRSSASGFRIFVPEFSEDITVSQFLSTFIKSATEDAYQKYLKDNPHAESLPQTEKNRIRLQLSQQSQKVLLENVSQKINQELTGKETLSSVIYQYLVKWFEKLPSQNQRLFLIGWVVFFFIGVWSLGYIVMLILPIIFWILFQLLKTIGFVKVARLPTEKEALTL